MLGRVFLQKKAWEVRPQPSSLGFTVCSRPQASPPGGFSHAIAAHHIRNWCRLFSSFPFPNTPTQPLLYFRKMEPSLTNWRTFLKPREVTASGGLSSIGTSAIATIRSLFTSSRIYPQSLSLSPSLFRPCFWDSFTDTRWPEAFLMTLLHTVRDQYTAAFGMDPGFGNWRLNPV